VEKYDDKHLVAPVWKDTVLIASTATADRKDKVWILLNSLKQNKQPGTLIQYYLFVPSEELKEFQTYLTGLPSEDFKVLILDADWFADKVDTIGTVRDHLYYAKCLFPQVFLNQDKLLFLDVDIVCVGPGIEDLWNTDIEGYWVGAVIDPTWQYCPYFKHDPQNTGTDHYFNAGVMLMNFKQMREDGKDKEFAEWCLHWDQSKLVCHCFDQTLCNYLLKDKTKLLPFKYNNSVLATLGIAQDSYRYYLNQCGYVEPLDSLQHAVLLHFCGSKKPWDAKALACGTDEYPYKEEAVELWQQLVRKYGPETDDEDGIQEDFGLTLSVQTPAWYVYDG
jgi:lipopolysaccharide biosynthesis glycosyltransferase